MKTILSLLLCLVLWQVHAQKAPTLHELVATTSCTSVPCVAAFAKAHGLCYNMTNPTDWMYNYYTCGAIAKDGSELKSKYSCLIYSFDSTATYIARRFAMRTTIAAYYDRIAVEVQQMGFKEIKREQKGPIWMITYGSVSFPGMKLITTVPREGQTYPSWGWALAVKESN